MRTVFFNVQKFEQEHLSAAAKRFNIDATFLEARLGYMTASLAQGYEVVCVFINDRLDEAVLESLHEGGTKLLALRSAGFNHVDLKAAKKFGIKVVRVPEYSPEAVAEHAVALLLCLNRKLHKAYNRVRENNFSLAGLVGSNLHGKVVGVIGTGKIGKCFIRIMKGFGCQVIAHDLNPDLDYSSRAGFQYMPLEEVLAKSDIISLHVPLTEETRHLIDEKAFSLMKSNCFLINTGRGALIDTPALIKVLKHNSIAGACLDVYEEEESLFFLDHSAEVPRDDVFARLLTFPNVLITGHQAFLTFEALVKIAETTFKNISDYQSGSVLTNEVLLVPER